jgi:hypothetical protein
MNMKNLIIAILSLLLTSGLYAQESSPKKEYLAPFTAIDVDAHIKLRLIKIQEYEAPYIVYDTKGSTVSKFSFDVDDKNRTLKISERHDPQRKTITEVDVYFSHLTDLSISKADTKIEGVLTAQLLDIYVSHGAHLTAEVDTLDVMVYATGKSRIELSGDTRYHTAEISTAHYNAQDLSSVSTIVESSHNAVARVCADERLEMKTSTGGKIYYLSQPNILRTRVTTFGGEITISK